MSLSRIRGPSVDRSFRTNRHIVLSPNRKKQLQLRNTLWRKMAHRHILCRPNPLLCSTVFLPWAEPLASKEKKEKQEWE